MRICSLRKQKGIAVYREGERDERGEATLNEAAEQLSVSPSTIRRMINAGILPASQLCKGAPWIIRHADLSHERVRQEADRRRERRPVSTDRLQTSFDL
jgi:excisionase family DNA binding protein